MTMYEKAAQQMRQYADALCNQSRRQLTTTSEAIDKFAGYIQCMVDNELCGGGFGAIKFEEFVRRISE